MSYRSELSEIAFDETLPDLTPRQKREYQQDVFARTTALGGLGIAGATAIGTGLILNRIEKGANTALEPLKGPGVAQAIKSTARATGNAAKWSEVLGDLGDAYKNAKLAPSRIARSFTKRGRQSLENEHNREVSRIQDAKKTRTATSRERLWLIKEGQKERKAISRGRSAANFMKRIHLLSAREELNDIMFGHGGWDLRKSQELKDKNGRVLGSRYGTVPAEGGWLERNKGKLAWGVGGLGAGAALGFLTPGGNPVRGLVGTAAGATTGAALGNVSYNRNKTISYLKNVSDIQKKRQDEEFAKRGISWQSVQK